MTRMDGGVLGDGGSDDDASMDDAGRPLGCIPVAESGDPNRAALTMDDGTGFPADFPFAIRSAFVAYDECFGAAPVMLVGLTDGTCVPTIGQQLLFKFRTNQIGTYFRVGGVYDIGSEMGSAQEIVIRFLSPRESGSGSDVWGTCMEASGTLTLEEIGVAVGEHVTGSYDLVLTDCALPLDQPPMTVVGTFDIPIEIALDPMCT